MNLIQLNDIVKISPKKALTDLSKSDKHRLMDTVLQHADSEQARGLAVTFELSSSGRRINNRLYTPRGQQDGVPSWTEPYAKPIIRNHDRQGDPIGRFRNVQWLSNHDKAMRFFKTARDYSEMLDAFESDDPQKIYKGLKKNNLLVDSKWPGIGHLEATALITDEDAVEKFMDGRYLTFSAGTHTDRYACGVCGADRAKSEDCEHGPGLITDEGDLGVFVTGMFHGDEGSVLSFPGNSFSMVKSMQFKDCADSPIEITPFQDIDESTIFMTDGAIETPEEKLPALDSIDPRDFARQVRKGELPERQYDALSGGTHLEIKWLIRAHDALHAEYDYIARYPSEDDHANAPLDVFKFHGALHDVSMQKDFRGSLVNGPLDEYDSKGAPSTEYVMKMPKSQDSTDTQETEMTEQELEALFAKVLKRMVKDAVEADETKTEVVDGQDAEVSKEQGKEEVEEVLDTKTADKPVEDNATDAAETASTEDTEEKAEEPAQTDAPALEQTSEDTKVESKGISLEDIKRDYAQALQTIDELKAQVTSFEQRLAEKSPEHANIADTNENEGSVKGPKSVSDPSVTDEEFKSQAPHEDAKRASKISGFEQKTLQKYKQILEDNGEAAAQGYISVLKRRNYLKKSFDVNTLIEES